MSIRKDLDIGSLAERAVMDKLKTAEIASSLVADKKLRSFYDVIFSLDGIERYIEVKHDVYASRSGNVAIEIFNPKSCKPSGINITKSDFWVHIVNSRMYICDTASLKKFINDVPPLRTICVGGDNNSSMVLYTMESILDVIFEDITDVSGTQLVNRLNVLYGRTRTSPNT